MEYIVDKLIYKRTGEVFPGEAGSVEITVSPDMDIFEYKTACVRIAHALGYHHNSIKDAFGDEEDVKAPNVITNQLKLLFD